MGVKKLSFLQKQSMLHQTQASLWVCTGCESTRGTPWQGRKIPVPACSSWVCFWAKLHGNPRLQLASVLHCALSNAVAPSLKPVPDPSEQQTLAPSCVWLCRQAEFLPGTGPAAPGPELCSLFTRPRHEVLCWCVHGLTCASPGALTKPSQDCGPGLGGCRGDSCFFSCSNSPVNFRVWSSQEILASLPRGIKLNMLFEN